MQQQQHVALLPASFVRALHHFYSLLALFSRQPITRNICRDSSFVAVVIVTQNIMKEAVDYDPIMSFSSTRFYICETLFRFKNL